MYNILICQESMILYKIQLQFFMFNFLIYYNFQNSDQANGFILLIIELSEVQLLSHFQFSFSYIFREFIVHHLIRIQRILNQHDTLTFQSGHSLVLQSQSNQPSQHQTTHGKLLRFLQNHWLIETVMAQQYYAFLILRQCQSQNGYSQCEIDCLLLGIPFEKQPYVFKVILRVIK